MTKILSSISKSKLHSVKSILDRLKDSLDVKKDIELAEFFGIAQNTISAWRKRNSMNYDLLIEKCLPLNIDLNWLIYGKLISQKQGEELIFQPVFKEENEYTEAEPERKAIQIVEMINKLPWPVAAKRIMMENYLYLVYREEREKHRKDRRN